MRDQFKNGDDHPPASPHCHDAYRNRYPDRIKGSFYSGGRSVSHQFGGEKQSREGERRNGGRSSAGIYLEIEDG